MDNQTQPSAQNDAAVVKYQGPTPGPWRSHGAGGEIHGNSRVVATMTWCSGLDVEDEANARLVAAAPDLLAALKASCGYLLNAKIDLETGCTKATAIRTIEGGLRMAGEAIAKATGEPVTRVTGGP